MDSGKIKRTIYNVPPFTSPRVRWAWRALKRRRRRVFERAGSDRYSHPAYHDLDRKLAEYLPERGGVFVEAGAYNGYFASNTYWFERFRNWTGVLVEPIPALADEARIERPRSQVFQCALVAPEANKTTIDMRFADAKSVVQEPLGSQVNAPSHAAGEAGGPGDDGYSLEVPARTLSDVLDEAGVRDIDMLSLDVEGYEEWALRGLDLRRHAPRYLLVEMLDESNNRPGIESVLGDRYIHEAELSGRDHLYRRVD